jgi:hypothetical protein
VFILSLTLHPADHSRAVLSLVGWRSLIIVRLVACRAWGAGRAATASVGPFPRPIRMSFTDPSATVTALARMSAADALLAQSTKADLAPAVGHRKNPIHGADTSENG